MTEINKSIDTTKKESTSSSYIHNTVYFSVSFKYVNEKYNLLSPLFQLKSQNHYKWNQDFLLNARLVAYDSNHSELYVKTDKQRLQSDNKNFRTLLEIEELKDLRDLIEQQCILKGINLSDNSLLFYLSFF
jgi:hypothetical protein